MKMNLVVTAIVVIMIASVFVGCPHLDRRHSVSHPLSLVAPTRADSAAVSDSNSVEDEELSQFLLDNPDVGEDGIEEDKIGEGIGLMGIRPEVVAEILREMDAGGSTRKLEEANKEPILTAGEE